MSHARARVLALFLIAHASALAVTSACSHPPESAASSRGHAGGAASSPAATAPGPTAAGATAAAPAMPVPETLAFTAGRFGLTMQAEAFTWKVLRRNATRFDWEGRPRDGYGERDVLYSFFVEKLDDASTKRLPEIATSAAANLSQGEPCRPMEQPAEVLKALAVERIVTVCFEPSTFYGQEHHQGVLHAVVANGALTVVVVLTDDRRALVPLPGVLGAIGARGAP